MNINWLIGNRSNKKQDYLEPLSKLLGFLEVSHLKSYYKDKTDIAIASLLIANSKPEYLFLYLRKFYPKEHKKIIQKHAENVLSKNYKQNKEKLAVIVAEIIYNILTNNLEVKND